MNKFQKLKNKRLNRIERRSMWYLGNGTLDPTKSGELADLVGQVGVNGTPGHSIKRSCSTVAVTAKVFSLDEYVPKSAKTSTWRNLTRLEKYDLASSYSSDTGLYEDQKLWKLTDWGFRVLQVYGKSIKKGSRIEWDRRELGC